MEEQLEVRGGSVELQAERAVLQDPGAAPSVLHPAWVPPVFHLETG